MESVSEEREEELKEREPDPTIKGDSSNVMDCISPSLRERVPDPILKRQSCEIVDWIITDVKVIVPIPVMEKRRTDVCKSIVIFCISRVPVLVVNIGPLPEEGAIRRVEETGLFSSKLEVSA